MTERDLIYRYATLRAEKDLLEAQLKVATKELEAAEWAVIEHMQDREISATGRHEGIGWIKERKPDLRVAYAKDYEEQVFTFVREQGMGPIIKESIWPTTFKSFCVEMLDRGVEIPEYISVAPVPKITFYKEKKK